MNNGQHGENEMRWTLTMTVDGETIEALETSSLEQATRLAEICNLLKSDSEPRWTPTLRGSK